MDQAKFVASWSKDRSTKVGAVIAWPDKFFIVGYNGFVRGADDELESRHEQKSGEKYYWSAHAERNAIDNCARAGISPKGATLYTTCMTCMDCARGIVQVGIIRVVAPMPNWGDVNAMHQRWKNHLIRAEQLFWESGVRLDYVEE